MRTGTVRVRRPPRRRCTVTRTLTRFPATTRRGARARDQHVGLHARAGPDADRGALDLRGRRSKLSTSDAAWIRSSSGVNASK